MGVLFFGTAALGLELMKAANEKFKFEGKNPLHNSLDSNVSFMKEEDRSSEFRKAGCEERIRHIREILHQELVSDYKSSKSNYDVALQTKKNEILSNLVRFMMQHENWFFV